MNSPKVTVLMSVYNGEKYLAEAIESVLNQTYRDFEFIIINDGSTDGTSDILTHYQKMDSRICIYNQENQGLIASLNRGCQLAKGEYIARMDADDISLPERFARQVDYMEAHPDVGVLGSQMEIINETGEPIGIYEVPYSHSMITWTLLFGRSFAHPSVIIRTSVIRESGGYYQSSLFSEDIDLWTRLVGCTQFANLPDTFVHYRTHAGAICIQHADEQRVNVIRARQQLCSRILGEEVPVEVLEWCYESQLPGHVLTDEQIEQVVTLILPLYAAMKEKGYLRTDELGEVHTDMVRRIIAAGRCTAQYVGRTAFADSQGSYWHSVLPTPLRRGILALMYTMRTAFVVLQRISLGLAMPKGRDVDRIPTTSDERMPLAAPRGNYSGITLVVLSYERMQALSALLRSVLKQDLAGIELELIICNNSPRVHLEESRFTSVGKLLRKFADVKIINSSYNWRCRARYAIATLAKYETILNLDDDIILVDRSFIRYMFDTYRSLRQVDLLSCWNTLWVDWTDSYFSTVSMTFNMQEIEELTASDTCGMGICMYSKFLLNPKLMERVFSRDYPEADDMAFSLVAALEHDSRRYYLPSYGMLKFHEQHVKGALYNCAGHYDDLYTFYRSLLIEGYQPVITRIASQAGDKESPVQKAVARLPVVRHTWQQ